MTLHRLGFVAVLLALGAGWGLTQPLGKIATSTGHGPYGLLFWQLVVGTLLLGALCLPRGRGLVLTRPALRFYGIVALTGTLIPGIAFYTSIARLPSGVMSVLISTVPLLAFPIALALGTDRFSLRRLAGLSIGLAGVGLVALPGSTLPDPAMAAFLPLALLAPLCYALESNYIARWGTAGLDPLQAMFGVVLLGAVLMLPLALASGQWIDPRPPYGRAELALILSAAVNALVYAGYVWLAMRAGAVFTGQVAYLVTAAGVLWAMALLGERFAPEFWAALVLILAGVAMVRPRGTDPTVPPCAAPANCETSPAKRQEPA